MSLHVDLARRLRRLFIEVRLDVGRETLGLVGPSGAGKTSVLRAIAGLDKPDAGRIACDGRAWFDSATRIDVAPDARSVGLVFQGLALFPHLTVARNVAYGLSGRGSGREQRAALRHVLGRFRLTALEGIRPGSLSGGERQRVALARAVAGRPSVLLLDEPLTALDPETKANVADELSRHLREASPTAILVSHDVADVMGLADRIAVMEAGRIRQVGTAAELVQAPASPFVAAFAGVNYFEGRAMARGHLTEVVARSGATFLSTERAVGPVAAVVPPWEIALAAGVPEGSALNRLAGPVSRVVRVANRVRITVASDPPVVAEITDASEQRLGLVPGSPVVASWKAAGTRLVPREGGTGAGAESVRSAPP